MLNHEMNALKKDLNQFGLDPKDWRLKRHCPQTVRIESLADENFVFIGRVFKKGNLIAWDQIQLLEI